MEERSEFWFTETAVMLLAAFIQPEMTVLEAGIGGSTRYLAGTGVKLVCIEHDAEWITKIAAEIGMNKAVQIIHAELPYHGIIEKQPDASFDLILIDGRHRVKCFLAAIPKLKRGGWLVLDNSERTFYQPALDAVREWNRIDCKQNQPDKYGFTYPDWTTTICIKP